MRKLLHLPFLGLFATLTSLLVLILMLPSMIGQVQFSHAADSGLPTQQNPVAQVADSGEPYHADSTVLLTDDFEGAELDHTLWFFVTNGNGWYEVDEGLLMVY